MEIIGIEKHYSGDKSWHKWVDMAKEEFWKESEYQMNLLKKLNGNLDLAVVIYARLGHGSMNWLDKKVSALENLTPLECLKSDRLVLRLRECLLRMP